MADHMQISEQKIRIELFRGLLQQLPPLLLTQVFIGATYVFILWNTGDHSQLLIWLGVLYSIFAARWLMVIFSSRHPIVQEKLLWLQWISMLFSVAYGFTWGASAILFLDPTQLMSFVAVISFIFGVGVGASILYAYHPPSYFCISIPMLGLLSYALLQNSDEQTIGLAAALTLLFVFSLSCNRFSNRVLNTSIRLRLENEALRQEAENKSDQLTAALRTAEQANAAKTRFLAAASHDLRQPIHALGLFFATLANKVRNRQTEPLIGQIEDSISAIDSMLNALLDVSKLDADVVHPNIGNVAVDALFARLRSEYQPVAFEHGNQLRFRETSAIVRSDPIMLEQILRNLVSNALRYTENGRILGAARRRGEQLRIEVYDTGPGVPEQDLQDIFLEFHQLGNPERDRQQGLGLGLAIVKRLATLLEHRIEVSSSVGKGSCFRLIVPLSQETPRPVAASDVTTYRSFGTELQDRHILVLDDDVDILKAMGQLLESWGCRVTTAPTPEQALNELQAPNPQPDLLIADYRLRNKVSGLDTAKELQQLTAEPLPVLIITGDTAPDRLREAERSGFPLLHKPVQPAKLRSAMRHLIRRSKD